MRLTLCLIAKDEEAMLPDCLASVEGVVDEIVVADTGSRDRTVEIARAAGATIVEHPWADDFAAARNAALAAATGDFVLVLDCDERLAEGAGDAIRAAMARPDLDCGMLPLHNASVPEATHEQVLSGACRIGEPILLPRLLRRTEDLCWKGIVHESVGHWLAGREGRIALVPARIVHYGAAPVIRSALRKDDRNLRLLEKRVAQEPGNPVAMTYLATEYLRVDRVADALDVTEAAWTALLEAVAAGERPSFVTLATLRMQLALASSDTDKALAIAAQCREWGSEHPNLDFFTGRAHELAGLRSESGRRDLALAGKAYCRALEKHGRMFSDEVQPGITSWLGEARLATVLVQIDEYETALAAVERCFRQRDDLVEAKLVRCEALVATGRAAAALAELEPLLGMDKPDPWLLAAEACIELGQPADAALFRKTARQYAKHGFVAPHRRALMPAALTAQPQASAPVPAVQTMNAPRVPLLGGPATVACKASERPVFIGGAGRSGTTLFRAMLHAHPRFTCPPELKLVTALAEMRQAWWSSLSTELQGAGVHEALLDQACRSFVGELIDGLAAPGTRLAEKTPHNVLYFEWLARLFPAARFVHLVRDPRAVAASLVRQDWVDPSTGKAVWYCQDAPSAATYWSRIVSRGLEQGSALSGRVAVVRYEDLAQQPEAVMRAVLDFLGEGWDARVLEHASAGAQLPAHESSSAAVRAPVHTAAIDKWRTQLSEAEVSEIERIAAPVMRQLGYSVSVAA